MKKSSSASLRREKQRNSPETIRFKKKINKFLENVEPEIAYAIKRDLSCMTNMPFYKERPKVIRFKMSPIDLICKYAELFKSASDKDFVFDLIRRLSKNQKQTIRKAAPKIGAKLEIWDHAIPTKVIVDEIIEMIKRDDLTDLSKLLDIYSRAGQRGLTKEQNKLLDKYKCSMPTGWDWQLSNVDPLARYKEVGTHR